MRGIPAGTPEYLRAQDLALASQDAASRKKKRR
jgi:hypothetical protein